MTPAGLQLDDAALAAKMPHAHVITLENTGHAMMQDAPDALAALITGALG